MKTPYRKTIADLWLDEDPFGYELEGLSKEQSQSLMNERMASAVVLHADGVESLLKPPTADIGGVIWDQSTQSKEVGTVKRWWRPSDFPMCVPPFRSMLVEVPTDAGRVGVLFMRHEDSVLGELIAEQDGGLWPHSAVFFKLKNNEIDEGAFGMHAAILAEGLDAALGVALMAISLTHCRNVTMDEHLPPPALSRRHAERRGRPLIRYYTLDITPMRKVLESEGRLGEVGLKRALHLCRGHFKDYRAGGGLFGKYKGLYWWDSNVRGSIELGVVAKDYAVKLPEVD